MGSSPTSGPSALHQPEPSQHRDSSQACPPLSRRGSAASMTTGGSGSCSLFASSSSEGTARAPSGLRQVQCTNAADDDQMLRKPAYRVSKHAPGLCFAGTASRRRSQPAADPQQPQPSEGYQTWLRQLPAAGGLGLLGLARGAGRARAAAGLVQHSRQQVVIQRPQLQGVDGEWQAGPSGGLVLVMLSRQDKPE